MNKLTSEQRNFINGQRYFNKINYHKFHPNNKELGPLNTAEWQKVFGGGYKKYLSEYFDTTDHNYRQGSNGKKGITKAYRPIKNLKQSDKLLRQTTPSIPLVNSYKVAVDKSRFEDVLSGKFKVEKQYHLIPVQYLYKRINDGFIYETYQRTFGKGRRFVVGIGVQQLPSYLKAYLFPLLKDYDMVNALPSITNQLVKGLHYETLNLYATQRNKFFKQTFHKTDLTYKEQKKVCLSVMFGANLNGQSMRDIVGDMCRLKDALPKLQNLKSDLEDLTTILSWDSRYEDLWNKAEHNNKRFLALVAQHYEDLILQSVEKYCKLNNHSVSVLMFDGFMSEDEIDLGNLNRFIKTDTGFSIELIYKE